MFSEKKSLTCRKPTVPINMRTSFTFFCYILCLNLLHAQTADRYLELTQDTLSHNELGANFLHRTFTPQPQAFFLNEGCYNDSRMWEAIPLGENICRFYAVEGKNLFTYFAKEMSARTYEASADKELYDLLGKLFRRALLLAEDTDSHTMGLDGNTYYFVTTDSCGKVQVAQKWSPGNGSLCRELTNLGDSIYTHIKRNNTNWNSIRQKTDSLLKVLESEPVDTLRNPTYRGIWQLGVQLPDRALKLACPPLFPCNPEKYLYDNMVYPPDMLAQNKGGYVICQFTIDTLGRTKNVFFLESTHSDFEKETQRLVSNMPHWLPALDESGKSVECMYAVHLSFRPQRYYTRLKREKAWEEKSKHLFINTEQMAEYPGGMSALLNFIKTNLQYPPSLIGSGKKVRVICQYTIDSYGYPKDFKVIRSGENPAFDEEALRILRLMPRWKPAVNHFPKVHFQKVTYTIPITFTDPADNTP